MTDDEQAFIREITARPEDLTTRLIYADWLDEHGDPRGEYIRLECQAASNPESAEAQTLRSMSYRLLTEYREQWVQALGPGVMWHRFRLGLIEDIVVKADNLLATEGLALRCAPVTRLGVCLRRNQVRAFAGLSALGQLTHLRMARSDLGDEGAEILATSVQIPLLVEWSLSHCDIGRAGLHSLASMASSLFVNRQLLLRVGDNPGMPRDISSSGLFRPILLRRFLRAAERRSNG